MLFQGPYSSESLQFAGISRVEGGLLVSKEKENIKKKMHWSVPDF